MIEQFVFLRGKDVLHNNEHAIKRFKVALGAVNALSNKHSALKDSRNRGLLAALVYYELENRTPVESFIRWVLDKDLHLIDESSSADFIAIFDRVLEIRKRTIFVSMPFGKAKADDHYAIIQRVCRELSEEHNLKPVLKVDRVDWFHDGTSYVINDKIIEMMSDCGLLIGNLTHCNPNVYHEVGGSSSRNWSSPRASRELGAILQATKTIALHLGAESPPSKPTLLQTIWIVDEGQDVARLVTAYPRKP